MGNKATLRPVPFTTENQPANRGRPKGTPNRATLLKKWLAVRTEVHNPITNSKHKGTVEDQIILALITKANEGDVPAIREVLDTIYGKLREQIEATITQKDFDVEIGGVVHQSEGEDEFVN